MVDAGLSRTQLRGLMPGPVAAWDGVRAAAEAPAATRRGRQARALVASLLGADAARVGLEPADLAAIGRWRSDPALPADDRAVLAFAEQFVLDVGALTQEQRARATAALGAGAFDFVQLLYVVDLGTRMAEAWRQLFGVDAVLEPAEPRDLWPALESFMAAVARLGALDPLTTEIVRLRGARAHNCRLCQSLRNVRAANDGVDETVYDQIDHYETSTLSDHHRVALRLVDAMLWQPCSYPAGLRAAVRGSFSDAEAAEVVLDVVRNAANKIAVALGADAAHVTEGLEYYDVDERGELVYALTPDC